MSKTFANVTPNKFAALRKFLGEAGVVMPEGNSGTISITSPAKVTIDFSYDGASVLTLTVTEKPFFIAESMIWSQVEGGLAKIA